MTRQAQVGFFTLLGLVALFGAFYVISDIGQRTSGYKLPVHFRSAAGLRPAALVYLAGVSVGVIDKIDLRPDYTTDVIVAVKKNIDIPVGSRFVINAPLTGEPNLLIVPPRPNPEQSGPIPTYPRDLAELSGNEPQGTNPATLTDLLEEGQGEVVRLDKMLAQFEDAEPQLLAELQSTLKNTNSLTMNANGSLTRLSAQASEITTQLSQTLADASSRVVDLTSTLDTTAKSGSVRVNSLLASLDTTATSLSASVDALRELATNPQIHQNLIATTRSVALTAKTFADLTGDLRSVTGNAATQAQMRDTVAHIDTAAQKADSLLAELGGRSSVPGVDVGATPAPGTVPPGGAKHPNAQATGQPSLSSLPGAFKAKAAAFAKNLAQVQIRLSQLAPERPGSAGIGSPLLGPDRGPQSDVNFVILPNAKANALVGVNDLGATSTWNFAAVEHAGNLRLGGGILYSRLGLLTGLQDRHFGVEARIYDLRHPTLDLYGSLFATPHLQLFGGERDTLQRDRRAVFGLQTQF